MNNETSVSIKFSNSVTGEKKLEKYAETLRKINSILGAIDTGKAKGMENSLKEPTKDANKLEKGLSTAFNTAKITTFIASINKLTKTISGYTKKSATYLENMNLLDVAFGNNTNEAKQFINTLSEMYGLDESWGTRTVGIFKQLANAMGLADEVGTKMSKTLTQLAIDTSSLYNIDVEDTVSILQSALAGQTKPSRRLGADITQSTLQLTLDTAGIDRAIEGLTYAEKRLVIVASLLNQTQQSFGDWGRTIESIANQMRIFQQQTERLTRALGNVFLPILKVILPYLNAFLMVLTEIINWFAILVGYNEEDFDFFGKTDQSVLDLSDGLASATENAKKLKSGLRGFDKLNNITTPSNTGAGVGAGAGGVDPEILNLFNKASDNYMKSLEKIEMKATKIRDKIMDWLGFTKVIDEETGDVSFKFDHITGGTVLGALAVGGIIYSGIKKIVGFFKSISTIKGLAGGLFDKLTKKGTINNADTLIGQVGNAGNSASKLNFKLPSFSTVLKGIGELALIIGACTAIVTVYGALSKIPGFTEFMKGGVNALVLVFDGISKILLPVLAISAISAGLGLLSSIVLPGLGILALIIAEAGLIVGAFGYLAKKEGFSTFITDGIDVMIKIFEGIEKIIIPVLAVGVVCTGLGIVSSVIPPGLWALAEIIGGATIVIGAFGLLALIPGIDKFVNGGVDLLCLVFEGIGKIIGSLVGGAIEVVSESVGESFANFGTHLSNFMTNSKVFFEQIKDVNPSDVGSIKVIAETVLLLTASDVLKGLTSWFTGGNSFEKFGMELEKFAPHFRNYAQQIQSINPSTIEKTRIASESMLILTKMAEEIPNSGGVVGFFVGENDLSDFSKMLPKFGNYMQQYSNNIKSLDSSVVSNSERIKNAMKHIIEFAKNIPNEGGVAGFFVGENNISTFGKNLKEFGKYFKEYGNEIKNVSIEKINSVTTSLKSIVDVAKTIKSQGLSKTISNFGEELKNSAKNIKSFYDNAFTYNRGWDLGSKLGGGIADAIANKLKNKVFPKIKLTDTSNNSTVGNYKITAYAQGGLPPVGQLFVANEKGAELVGNIGGQSFVANQNQVIDLIDRKLQNATGGIQNATFVIKVGDKEVAKQVINDLQDMAKNNGKPITIGG